jgi:hypothetical protein
MPQLHESPQKSLIGRLFGALSGLLRGSPGNGAPEQILPRSDFSCADVPSECAEPVRDTGSIEATGPINAPAKDYAMADAMDAGVAELRTKLSEYSVSGRKYITWEANLWRVRVKGKHVGYYRSISAAVSERNAHCRKVGISLKRGE